MKPNVRINSHMDVQIGCSLNNSHAQLSSVSSEAAIAHGGGRFQNPSRV